MGLSAAKFGGLTAGLAILSFASVAQAQVSTVTLPPAGYVFVTSTSQGFNTSVNNAGNIQSQEGSLVSAVYRNTTNNTYDFLYQINVVSSTAAITGINISDFTGDSVTQGQAVYTSGVGPFTGAANVAATSAIVFSGTAEFSFNDSGAVGIQGSQSSDTLFIATNSLAYSLNNAVIAGPVGSNVSAYAANITGGTASVAAPEPGALALVIPGLLGVVGMVSRRKRA